MKKKKIIAFLLIFICLFTWFPTSLLMVEAASVTDITFETVREDMQNGPVDTQRLIIYGLDFNNAQVFGGDKGSRPLSINTALSTKNTLIIDDSKSLNEIVGKTNQINVYNNNGADLLTAQPIIFDLSGIVHVRDVSNNRVYVGEPVNIGGMGFSNIDTSKDKLYISGTQYTMSKAPYDPNSSIAYITSDSGVSIGKVLAPNFTGVNDIKVIRYADDTNYGRKYEITAIYKNSIRVVGKLTDIEVERIDPNVGPRNRENIISIYGKSDINKSSFTSSMRIFAGTKEGKNLGTIKDITGKVIGLSAKLPISDISGAVNLTISNSDKSSELLIEGGFIYLDIGNSLSIDANGITPNFKKETDDSVIEIKGRNIGYFVGAGYESLTVDLYNSTFNKGYDYLDYGRNSYVLEYTGKYKDTTAVVIRKQIEVYVDGYAHIIEGLNPDNSIDHSKDRISISKDKDTIYVNTVNVNLPEPKQPKPVDVVIKTRTKVVDPVSGKIIYDRTEEYSLNDGFTFIPNEIFPVINSATPNYGPNNKDIYVTLKGKNFQVTKEGTADAKYPSVIIGSRTYTFDKNNPGNFAVYDDNNRIVDGKALTLGTKIKFVMKAPASPDNLSGAIDIIVRNPSGGQNVLVNGFTFRNPTTTKLPIINEVKENHSDIRGGLASGEVVTIIGDNFDTSSDNNPRVLVTIDGEKATLVGKVSSDGKTMKILAPPGTIPGWTQLQIINQDGGMASTPFEYRLVTSAPKIAKIIPVKGGKGTKLIIKGEDFILPDRTTLPNDPKRKGSIVLLNGIELNAYNYDGVGDIVGVPPTDVTDPNNPSDFIYYYKAGGLKGEMTKVQDITTIYVDLPDKFYSFDKNAANHLYSEPIPIGDLSVEVLNPDGARSKETVKFKYMQPQTQPTISSIDPNSGSINGGTMVTIRGTNFKPDNIEVYFGSEKSLNVLYISSLELRVLVPIYPYQLPAGADHILVPLTVQNYDGGTAVYYDTTDQANLKGFTYRRPGSNPIISSVQNSEGLPKASTAGGDLLIIRGRDFRVNPNVPGDKPKIYFSGIAVPDADVTWYNDMVVTVVAPASKIEGATDIVLVNFDSGSYTYKNFMYEKSKPTITSITPSTIAKSGKINVQINGKNFRKGNLSAMLQGEPASTMETIVAFGDETTGDKKVIDTIIGLPFTIMGNMRVQYARTSDPEQFDVSILKEGTTTVLGTRRMKIGDSHIFIITGTKMGDTNIGDEGVLVEVTPNNIVATRRIATYAAVENSGFQISVKTPPIASVGSRKLHVINNDGGQTEGTIMVTNPASNPIIKYISPRNKVKKTTGEIVDYTDEGTKNDATHLEYYVYTPLNGGAFVTINGADFRKNVKVFLDDKALEIVSRSLNDDQIIVKVPKGTSSDLDKLYRIVVMNEDGGSADSANPAQTSGAKPNYIVYKMPQSAPIIEYVSPPRATTRGKSVVSIIGDDFRDKAQVFIGGIKAPSVFYDPIKGYKELIVQVPDGLAPGKTMVQVLNNDYGFGEKKDAMTIISSPRIDSVYDDKGRALDPVIFSIEGGQKIALNGIEFMESAKILIGGRLKDKSELASGETGITCYTINNVEKVYVGGTEAADVKVGNGSMLSFVTPKLPQGSSYNLVIINKDGGVSNIITLDYMKPYPDMPDRPYIEVVDADTIKVEWEKAEGVSYYEIYISDVLTTNSATANYKYLGSIVPDEIQSTGIYRYYIDGLKPLTWYSVKLKSVNAFGASPQFSMPSDYKKTKETKIMTYYQRPGQYAGGIAQSDAVSFKGSAVTFSAGEKSIGNYALGLTVDFNQPKYAKANPKAIDIGYDMIKKYPTNTIKIIDKNFSLIMMAKNLSIDEMKKINSSKYPDSRIRVVLNKLLGSRGDDIRNRLPKGYSVIIAPFRIGLEMQVEKTVTPVRNFNGAAALTLNYTPSYQKKYQGGIYIAYYDNAAKAVVIINTKNLNGAAQAQILKSGEYMLLGKLRK